MTWLLWIFPLFVVPNTYFVWHGALIYLRDRARSPLLLIGLGVKAFAWLANLFLAVLAMRYIVGLPPLPLNGWALLAVLVAVLLLPGFVHWQMRRIERSRG